MTILKTAARETKTISDNASVDTQERCLRNDFCNGAKRTAPRRSLKWTVTYQIRCLYYTGYLFVSARKAAICIVYSKHFDQKSGFNMGNLYYIKCIQPLLKTAGISSRFLVNKCLL